jgi:hypothetical protein
MGGCEGIPVGWPMDVSAIARQPHNSKRNLFEQEEYQ